jgi:hypothetical protein
MKINKRIFYIFSSLLILGYSVLLPFSKVSALEKKDDLPAFNETKDISVEFGKFKSGDLTYIWYNYLFNKKKDDSFNFVWDCPVLTRDQAKSSYDKAVANNEGWLVTQREFLFDSLYQGKKTLVKTLQVYWSEKKLDKQLLKYYKGFGYYWQFNDFISNGIYYLDMRYDDSGRVRIGCSDIQSFTPNYSKITALLSSTNERISQDDQKNGYYDKTSTLINTFPYEVDEKTIGDKNISIRDAYQQTLYPHFEYNLKYLKLKLHHLKKEDSIKFPDAWASFDNKKGYYIADKSDYYVQFTVQKRKGGDVIQNGLQYIKADGSFEVDLPSLDEYSVTANYTTKVCYAYSYDRDKTITPAEGDYCFYTPPDEKQDLKYGQRTAYIKADGSVKNGSTLGLVCNDGFCSELKQKPKYEDCSVYDYNFNGLKIPSFGSVACAIRNSFIWFFTDFIFGIIFPKIEDIQSLWDDLLNTIIDRLGFLALPFTFIKGVFTTVQAMTTTNNTCALSLTIFGSTANIEMCKWRYQLPAVWSFMQTILQGGIAIGFLWTCYRLANRFFGIYVEDYEEEDHDTMIGRWHDERTGEYGEWQKFRKDKD